MKYKDYPKLIDRCNVIFKINGKEGFEQVREWYSKPNINELVEHAAREISKAGLQGNHMVSFDLVVHAQEIED